MIVIEKYKNTHHSCNACVNKDSEYILKIGTQIPTVIALCSDCMNKMLGYINALKEKDNDLWKV